MGTTVTPIHAVRLWTEDNLGCPSIETLCTLTATFNGKERTTKQFIVPTGKTIHWRWSLSEKGVAIRWSTRSKWLDKKSHELFVEWNDLEHGDE